MNSTNIYIAGVGGQGLVLSTKIIAEAAFHAGYDIRTNDVIGLSQRGGKIFGSIRFGDKIYSSQIPKGQGDILLAFEMLEGLRWASQIKVGGTVIMNNEAIYPNRVLLEKDEYPENIDKTIINMGLNYLPVNAMELAKEAGNIKTSNIVMIGMLSTLLPFKSEIWINSIKSNVPEKSITENLYAFELGQNH